MADEKYRIEGDTLIINDGVTTIEGTDFHTYNEKDGYEGVKDEKFQNVKKVVLPDSVTEIDYDAFYDFQSLKDISLPNSITNIGNYAFTDCINLENVIIPDSVTSIDWYAFMHCTSLKSITIPNSVTSIDEFAFWGCENLTIVCNKGSYAEKYAKENDIPIEFIDKKIYHIEGDTLIINDGVTIIDIDDFHYEEWEGEEDEAQIPRVFDDIKDIRHIIVPESVTDIGEFAFSSFPSLEDISLPNNITNIEPYAFWFCENLKSISIPDGVTEIGEDAFSNCKNLKNIVLPSSVTSIGGGAFGCCDFTSITIPNNVEKIEDFAFYDCTSLKSVTIPDSVTYIGESVFSFCTNLTNITIPNSVTNIDFGVFQGCTNLKSVTIPSSVTNIGYAAFADCNNLTIRCDKYSYVEKYAKENNIPVEYIGEHTKEQALSQIKDYINTLAEAMKHYDGKGDVGTYLEGYVGSSGADLGAFLSETSAAYIRNCFVSAYSGVDFNYTDDKSPIERYETRISSAARQATSLAEELVNKSEKTSVEEIVDDVMHNEDFKKILKKELKAEIPENHKDNIISGKINEQDGNEIIGTDINTDCPVKEECAVYIRDIKDTILENGAGTLTLDDFGDKHYNVQIESDSEIYTFKVSLPVSKTVGGVKVQGFKELGYIDTGKDEVGKTLKEIAENTAVVTSRKNGSKSLNEIFKDNKGKTLD